MHVVDSSGWLAYFLASANGPYFRKVIQNQAELIVPAVAIYEVHKRLSGLVPAHDVQDCIDAMRSCAVVPITDQRAIAASLVAQQTKLAMADAMIYATAQEFNATLWTQDADYAKLPGVKYRAIPTG